MKKLLAPSNLLINYSIVGAFMYVLRIVSEQLVYGTPVKDCFRSLMTIDVSFDCRAELCSWMGKCTIKAGYLMCLN